MAARPAVGIIHRRELAAAEDPDAARDGSPRATPRRTCCPRVAAAGGYIDELIAPARDPRAPRVGAPTRWRRER